MKPRLCVDAQQMHQFFGIARVFRKWFTESIAEHGFKSGRDYTPYNKRQTGKGRPAVDYLVSPPMAREMAASLPNNLRAVQCDRYVKEVEASGKLPSKAGVPSVLDVIEKKLPPPATPSQPPAPAVVSLRASSIPVIKGVIGGVDTLVVDARSLHEFLNVGRHFATWIKGRILNSQYFEGIDYVVSAPTQIRPSGVTKLLFRHLFPKKTCSHGSAMAETRRKEFGTRHRHCCPLKLQGASWPPARMFCC